MTKRETNAMRDAYRLLDAYSDMTISTDEYWESLADDVQEYADRNRSHPLAVKLGVAIVEYLEIKRGHGV